MAYNSSKQTVMKSKLSVALLNFAIFFAFLILIILNLYPIIHNEDKKSQKRFAPNHQHKKQDLSTKKHHKSKELVHEHVKKGKV